MRSSYYVIAKQGNGPFYAKGDYAELLYEVYLPCEKGSGFNKDKCKACHEGTRGEVLDGGIIVVTIGAGQIHQFIDDALASGEIRHGSAVLFYLSPEDAFAEIGADSRVKPNSALCFRIEEVSFSSYSNRMQNKG